MLTLVERLSFNLTSRLMALISVRVCVCYSELTHCEQFPSCLKCLIPIGQSTQRVSTRKKELHIRAAVRINGRPILNGGPEYMQKSQILTRVMQPQIQSLFPSDNL